MTNPTTTELLAAMELLTKAGVVVVVDTDPVKTAAKLEEVAKTKNGETVVIPPTQAIGLVSKYKAAEIVFANAKDAFEAVRGEVQTLMGDATELLVEDMVEPIATWRWGAKTTFDKDGLVKEAPELVEKYTATDPEGLRSFRFPGIKATR